jgi:hypothetical protein
LSSGHATRIGDLYQFDRGQVTEKPVQTVELRQASVLHKDNPEVQRRVTLNALSDARKADRNHSSPFAALAPENTAESSRIGWAISGRVVELVVFGGSGRR